MHTTKLSAARVVSSKDSGNFPLILNFQKLLYPYTLLYFDFVTIFSDCSWAGWRAGLRHRSARVQIAALTLSGNSLRQTVHTHRAFVHQAAKLVAALLGVAWVTAGLMESNGSLPLGLWLMSPAGWLPRTGISSRTLRSAIEYGLPLPFFRRVYDSRHLQADCQEPWSAPEPYTW